MAAVAEAPVEQKGHFISDSIRRLSPRPLSLWRMEGCPNLQTADTSISPVDQLKDVRRGRIFAKVR